MSSSSFIHFDQRNLETATNPSNSLSPKSYLIITKLILKEKSIIILREIKSDCLLFSYFILIGLKRMNEIELNFKEQESLLKSLHF